MSTWLRLQEYSNKYGVSISTLRRKIKCQEIEYTFKNGRYLLKASEEESDSIKELKYLLKKQEIDIKKLKEDRENLFCLVRLLEKEKVQFLNYLENQKTL